MSRGGNREYNDGSSEKISQLYRVHTQNRRVKPLPFGQPTDLFGYILGVSSLRSVQDQSAAVSTGCAMTVSIVVSATIVTKRSHDFVDIDNILNALDSILLTEVNERAELKEGEGEADDEECEDGLSAFSFLV